MALLALSSPASALDPHPDQRSENASRSLPAYFLSLCFQVSVDISSGAIRVAVLEGSSQRVLMEGKLTHKINTESSLWSLEPGKCVLVRAERCCRVAAPRLAAPLGLTWESAAAGGWSQTWPCPTPPFPGSPRAISSSRCPRLRAGRREAPVLHFCPVLGFSRTPPALLEAIAAATAPFPFPAAPAPHVFLVEVVWGLLLPGSSLLLDSQPRYVFLVCSSNPGVVLLPAALGTQGICPSRSCPGLPISLGPRVSSTSTGCQILVRVLGPPGAGSWHLLPSLPSPSHQEPTPEAFQELSGAGSSPRRGSEARVRQPRCFLALRGAARFRGSALTSRPASRVGGTQSALPGPAREASLVKSRRRTGGGREQRAGGARLGASRSDRGQREEPAPRLQPELKARASN